MPTMSALRSHPHFAPLFAHVFVLCWPILVWQINRLFSWSRREGYPNLLYTVSRWGFIIIVYLGNKEDPDAYKPLARTFRPLTDASYASDLPANLATSESFKAVTPLCRSAAEVAPKGPERALAPLVLDSTWPFQSSRRKPGPSDVALLPLQSLGPGFRRDDKI